MLPFQRTFISSYPKATQDTQRLITAVSRNGEARDLSEIEKVFN